MAEIIEGAPPAKRAKPAPLADEKAPRPRNVLLAEFEGLAKADASQALRDTGGDLDKARALLRSKREPPAPVTPPSPAGPPSPISNAELAQLRREREARRPPPRSPRVEPPGRGS